MVITVFLAVLVLALLIGNILLSATIPGKKHESLEELAKRISRQAKPNDLGGDAKQLKERIGRLENLLLRVNNAEFLGKKLDGTKLAQKLKELSEFKQNAKIEIAALKERLDEIYPVKPKNQGVPDISDEKLHEIIYQVKKK